MKMLGVKVVKPTIINKSMMISLAYTVLSFAVGERQNASTNIVKKKGHIFVYIS